MTSIIPQRTGFFAYHANRLEDLRKIVVTICDTAPLPPLHNDMCLVQSNGIAQWLKLGLAQTPQHGGLGIAVGMDFSLPSKFIWQAYRAVLSVDQVPNQSPLDKGSLIWRLYRLLVGIEQQAVFGPLKKFLDGDNPDIRRFQLADRIASLFDQYQMYRADWLDAWESGRDVIYVRQKEHGLAPEHLWQAHLWRLLLKDVGSDRAATSRASVHSRFLQVGGKIEQPATPELLPKRIIVFGVSALPKQILEALQVLSRFTQVVFCVSNPCQYYWGDIISQRDMIISEAKHAGSISNQLKRRHQSQEKLASVSMDEMHQHANPLLASLGKQGRDYIRLLEEFDEAQSDYALALQQEATDVSYLAMPERMDVFQAYGEADKQGNMSMLHLLQNDIFDLTPIEELLGQQRILGTTIDGSIAFHEVHSEQRELEVLHDQLLNAFNNDQSLKPKDILVMTPDINKYAPHINAVFGLHERSDKRFIPFTISDQGLRNQDPNIIAFENLLSISQSRFTYSDVMSLLELPAISEKFGFEIQALDTVKNWIQGANIRWGLNAKHRAEFVQVQNLNLNTWQNGLRSMLLGYSMGDAKSWGGHIAFTEIGGLEAKLIGNLIEFIDALIAIRKDFGCEHTVAEWQTIIREILETFYADSDISTMAIKSELIKQTEKLAKNTLLADSSALTLPITTVKEVILDGLDAGTLNHRFLMGRVNFATLMPMRAIPFKRIFLLGMNDGAFPRSKKPIDFDLMANDYRAGDRSMREDDRYLFLEALLAARESLYISWVGRSINDDSERPPSVLVAQLRDYIDKFWRVSWSEDSQTKRQAAVSHLLTSTHPLQPFSVRYFPRLDSVDDDTQNVGSVPQQAPLFTYAAEWRHGGPDQAPVGELSHHKMPNQKVDKVQDKLPFIPLDTPLKLHTLSAFLKKPVQYFFNRALMIDFESSSESDFDNEMFVMGHLDAYSLDTLLIEKAILPSRSLDQLTSNLAHTLSYISDSGEIGLASTQYLVHRDLSTKMQQLGSRYLMEIESLTQKTDMRVDIRHRYQSFDKHELAIEDTIDDFWASKNGSLPLRVVICDAKLVSSDKKATLRLENLIGVWIQHLAGHAVGVEFTTKVLAKEAPFLFVFTSIAQSEAIQALNQVLQTWQQGMTQPLKLDSHAASVYLQSKDPALSTQDISSAYLDYTLKFDVGYFRRAFPDSEDITCSPEFTDLCERLYRPMMLAMEVLEHE